MAALQGKRIAVVVTDGFEQVELTSPKKALEAAGATVDILSDKSCERGAGAGRGFHARLDLCEFVRQLDQRVDIVRAASLQRFELPAVIDQHRQILPGIGDRAAQVLGGRRVVGHRARAGLARVAHDDELFDAPGTTSPESRRPMGRSGRRPSRTAAAMRSSSQVGSEVLGRQSAHFAERRGEPFFGDFDVERSCIGRSVVTRGVDSPARRRAGAFRDPLRRLGTDGCAAATATLRSRAVRIAIGRRPPGGRAARTRRRMCSASYRRA